MFVFIRSGRKANEAWILCPTGLSPQVWNWSNDRWYYLLHSCMVICKSVLKDAEVFKFIDIDVHTLCILRYCAQSHEMYFVFLCVRLPVTCYLMQTFTNYLQTNPNSKQYNYNPSLGKIEFVRAGVDSDWHHLESFPRWEGHA